MGKVAVLQSQKVKTIKNADVKLIHFNLTSAIILWSASKKGFIALCIFTSPTQD